MPVRRLLERTGQEQREPTWKAGSLIVVMDALMGSVAGVYLATGSIFVTIVAGACGIVLAGWLAAIDQ